MKGRYYSLNEYLQSEFGEKVYKLALDLGVTCPNRDGRLDTRGCIFCLAGSSHFAAAEGDINQKIDKALENIIEEQTKKQTKTSQVSVADLDIDDIYEKVYRKIERTLRSEMRKTGR